MATRKQYLPQVMYRKYRSGEWRSAMNGNKRYADTLEEAKQAIEDIKNYWDDQRNGKRINQVCGSIGISVEPIKDDTFEIVATRIRVREVTDWEEVE